MMTYRSMFAEWKRRRRAQLGDIRHLRRPRRYAFRLRDIRAAFARDYQMWDLLPWKLLAARDVAGAPTTHE